MARPGPSCWGMPSVPHLVPSQPHGTSPTSGQGRGSCAPGWEAFWPPLPSKHEGSRVSQTLELGSSNPNSHRSCWPPALGHRGACSWPCAVPPFQNKAPLGTQRCQVKYTPSPTCTQGHWGLLGTNPASQDPLAPWHLQQPGPGIRPRPLKAQMERHRAAAPPSPNPSWGRTQRSG